MQAIILAGGRGIRLQPYTTILPKPLMPIGEKAILELILLQLKQTGFEELIFTVGYLGELIEAYFGDGKKWKIKIRYSREKEPLGTVGPLTLVDDLAPQFLVMNGDVLCDLDYGDLMQVHADQKNDITICSYPKKIKIDLGVLEFKKQKLSDYIEKPEYTFSVSMGIYSMNRSLVKQLPRAKYYDLPTLVNDRLKTGAKTGVYNFLGQWYDIGRIEDCLSAQEKFIKNPQAFLRPKGRRKK